LVAERQPRTTNRRPVPELEEREAPDEQQEGEHSNRLSERHTQSERERDDSVCVCRSQPHGRGFFLCLARAFLAQ
jgi:hypothetical protein